MNWLQKIGQRTPELQAIVDKWKFQIPELALYVYEDENKITLSSIIIPRDMRKQGIGTQIMQDLTNYADQINKRMELSPAIRDPYTGTTSRNRLVRFYKGLGFKENKGRNKDYTMTETMFRNPVN